MAALAYKAFQLATLTFRDRLPVPALDKTIRAQVKAMTLCVDSTAFPARQGNGAIRQSGMKSPAIR